MQPIDQIDGEVLIKLPYTLKEPEILLYYDGPLITHYAKPQPLIEMWLDINEDVTLWLIFEVPEYFKSRYKVLSEFAKEQCILWNHLQKSKYVILLQIGKETQIKKSNLKDIDPELLIAKPSEELYELIGYDVDYAKNHASTHGKNCVLEEVDGTKVQFKLVPNTILLKTVKGVVIEAKAV